MEGVHPPPSEKLWCIHNATGGELPFASSSRCSASRRTNGRSASDVPPEVKKSRRYKRFLDGFQLHVGFQACRLRSRFGLCSVTKHPLSLCLFPLRVTPRPQPRRLRKRGPNFRKSLTGKTRWIPCTGGHRLLERSEWKPIRGSITRGELRCMLHRVDSQPAQFRIMGAPFRLISTSSTTGCAFLPRQANSPRSRSNPCR